MNHRQPLLSLFEEQQRWSLAASAAKKQINNWRVISLTTTVVGAFLVTLSTQVGSTSGSRILAILGGTCVASAPIITSERLGATTLTTWARLRSVSEALKTEGFLFLTCTNPYDGTDRASVLVERKQKLLDVSPQLVVLANRTAPTGVRVPEVHDAESYFETRVRGQIDPVKGYYPRNADKEERALERANSIKLLLGLLAGGFGVVAGTTNSTDVAAWVPVLTTVIGALLADVAARRHESNLLEYSRTLRRLERLTEEWRAQRANSDDPTILDACFVTKCEDAISTENKGWMAAFDPGAAGGK